MVEAETAIRAAGGVAARRRMRAEWESSPQGRAVAAEPWIRFRPGDREPRAHLDRLRVLDFTRVLAGPTITRSWREHLRRDPVPQGQRVLFNRRWLSADEGELPSAVQAACWLDMKRVYIELKPELRRLYTSIRDIATHAPIITPLGFVPLPEAVELDGVSYHSAHASS